MASALVAISSAILLSPGDVLRDDQIRRDGDTRQDVGWGKLERKATAEAQS